MMIEEVYKYFGSSTRMQEEIGLSHSNFQNWRNLGYIPIATQMRIERLTSGELKADLAHCRKVENGVIKG